MHDCYICIHAASGHTGGWSLVYILCKSLCHVSPRIPKFPVLLVRRLHRTREYLDPVSISLKTSIMQTGLIRSALIAISNDGNNMKLCVRHPHPSPAVVLLLQCCVQFCPAPCLSCLELVCEWALWWWWRADVAGALLMVWGQTLDWAWRALKESQAFDIMHQASVIVCGSIQTFILHHRSTHTNTGKQRVTSI